MIIFVGMTEKLEYCTPQSYLIELAQAESLLAGSFDDMSDLEDPVFHDNWNM